MTKHNLSLEIHLPRSVALVGLIVLFILFQVTAFLRGMVMPNDIPMLLPLKLSFVANGLWAVGGVLVLRLLWRRQVRARLAAVGLLIGFSIYSLLRLLLLSQADYDRGRWPILLLLLAVLLIIPVTYMARAGRANNQLDGDVHNGSQS